MPSGTDKVASEPDAIPALDANLATRLGRPKMADAPEGNLGKLFGGRSILAPKVSVENEEEGDALSDTSALNAAYDEAKVMEAWDALVADFRTKNKMGLAATLATGEKVFDNPVLKLTVANQVQYDELKECAAQLVHFIRVHVGNGSIGLEVELGELDAPVEFLTPKDRYDQWASAQPALETLRKRLDLDLS